MWHFSRFSKIQSHIHNNYNMNMYICTYIWQMYVHTIHENMYVFMYVLHMYVQYGLIWLHTHMHHIHFPDFCVLVMSYLLVILYAIKMACQCTRITQANLVNGSLVTIINNSLKMLLNTQNLLKGFIYVVCMHFY